MIHNTIVCAPDGLRVINCAASPRMQLIRTLASWHYPDLTANRDLDSAYRIALTSLARRYLDLHDEIADLDASALCGLTHTQIDQPCLSPDLSDRPGTPRGEALPRRCM